MKLIKFELLKLFTNRFYIFLAFLFIALNSTLFYWNATQKNMGYPQTVYKNVYADLSGLSNEEKVKKIQQQYDDIQMFTVISNINEVKKHGNIDALNQYLEQYKDKIPAYLNKYQSGNYLHYTDSLFAEGQVLGTVLKDLQTVAAYPQYLQSIDDNAAIMSGSSLFSEPNTFAYRNIVKTPKAFAHLKSVTLTGDISNGVVQATQSNPTDIILCLWMLLTCMALVLPEKEKGLVTLIKPKINGYHKTISAKIFTVLIFSVLSVTALFGINTAISAFLFGFGYLNRPLQSVSGFIGSPFKITVLQYFILYFLTKIFSAFLLSLIFLFLCIRLRNPAFIYLGASILVGSSIALYQFVPVQSAWGFFHYINLALFLQVTPLYQNYVNINLLGDPFNLIPSALISSVTVIFIFSVWTVHQFCKPEMSNNRFDSFLSSLRKSIHLFLPPPSNSLFKNELYKQLVTNKIAGILILVFVFQAYSYFNMDYTYSTEDLYYRQYMNVLQGGLSDSKIKFIEAEQQELNKTSEALQRISEQYTNGEIDSQRYQAELSQDQRVLEKEPAFSKVVKQYQYILQENERGNHPYFVYDTGISQLTGGQGNDKDLFSALKLCTILIACLSTLFTIEYSTGAIYLIHTTKNGRRKTFFVKLLVGFLFAIMAYWAVYLPDLLFVFINYGTGGLNFPADSLPFLSAAGSSMTIIQYLVSIYALRIVGMLGVIAVVVLVSVTVKNSFTSLLVSTIFLIFPILMCLFGQIIFVFLPPDLLLLGNIIFQYRYRLYYTVIAIFAIFMFFMISNWKFGGFHLFGIFKRTFRGAPSK